MFNGHIFDFTQMVKEYEAVLDSLNIPVETEYFIHSFNHRWQEPTISGDKAYSAYITIISSNNKHYALFVNHKLSYIIENPSSKFFEDVLIRESIGIHSYDGAIYGVLVYGEKIPIHFLNKLCAE